ncbi:PREDICTED: regulator of chromosome condensation isoform X4 [Cercocebus atys]|uniref:regulator of chromosome condensation isoform X4 n=1 Tax=Cercocebus atys TaxID=9531 RepID=UPI0005F51647|nr:PREDICTED: regulator of chromosome condensation isoform X4 [Cercocebus atys]
MLWGSSRPGGERWSSLRPTGTEDRKMSPKRIAKRRSPPADAIPKSKKVKDARAAASRRIPGARSCQGACGPSPPDQKTRPVSHRSHSTEPGLVLTLGQGDVGQLGLGENVMERKKPALVSIPEDVVQAEAGGMHTVCLSKSGQVYSFGCNDEGALGRDTSVEGSEMIPGKVELQEKVVQVSAGDSHTAALTEDGRVFLWGSFRDNNGVIGLLEPMKKSMVPVQVQLDVPVVKVASGNDHLVMLTAGGDLYTLGCGEQGQLGRVPELFANRGGRQGLERLLVPKCVMLKSRGSRGHVRFQDAFCGAYFTFAISHEGHVYGFGLSNYHQLGTPGTESCFIPQNLTSFKNSTKSWVGFSGGQHHTVCMDSEGRVFAWGMGTNYQLGTGQDEDAWSPVEMTGKQLENRVVLSVSSGGQHTVLLVKDKEQS